MKKTLYSCLIGCGLVLLAAAWTIPGGRGRSHDVSITIEPDQAKVLPAFEGGKPPTFTVETEPEAAVSIMVATEFNQLITEPGQSIAKVFISFFGSETAQIPGTVLKADEEGRLTYTLPTSVFKAMSLGTGRIYYVAEVIEARDGGHYDTLAVSFDYQSGDEADAPSIVVAITPRLAKAQERFKSGLDLYYQEEYDQAIPEFQAVLELVPSFRTEYNIGLCHLNLCLKSLNSAVDARQLSAKEQARIQQFITMAKDFMKNRE